MQSLPVAPRQEDGDSPSMGAVDDAADTRTSDAAPSAVMNRTLLRIKESVDQEGPKVIRLTAGMALSAFDTRPGSHPVNR